MKHVEKHGEHNLHWVTFTVMGEDSMDRKTHIVNLLGEPMLKSAFDVDRRVKLMQGEVEALCGAKGMQAGMHYNFDYALPCIDCMIALHKFMSSKQGFSIVDTVQKAIEDDLQTNGPISAYLKRKQKDIE